ncbi:hypothetical protein GC093_04920 [Paenibacillus sp. LMG 31456]|uniref:Uncharacterized protein n=1 Tax=Paenibacillus foliorum TaxID=2654974 RepID=A0A972JXL2_9BACL|nr:hypothetical protein [Paenibacillus foliorum]NOU92574.1 hypothetical protein [Paenibacillus foliorum]
MVERIITIHSDPETIKSKINADLNEEYDVEVVGISGNMTLKVTSLSGAPLNTSEIEEINSLIDDHYNM